MLQDPCLCKSPIVVVVVAFLFKRVPLELKTLQAVVGIMHAYDAISSFDDDDDSDNDDNDIAISTTIYTYMYIYTEAQYCL